MSLSRNIEWKNISLIHFASDFKSHEKSVRANRTINSAPFFLVGRLFLPSLQSIILNNTKSGRATKYCSLRMNTWIHPFFVCIDKTSGYARFRDGSGQGFPPRVCHSIDVSGNVRMLQSSVTYPKNSFPPPITHFFQYRMLGWRKIDLHLPLKTTALFICVDLKTTNP